jgi:hypothetical protein
VNNQTPLWWDNWCRLCREFGGEFTDKEQLERRLKTIENAIQRQDVWPEARRAVHKTVHGSLMLFYGGLVHKPTYDLLRAIHEAFDHRDEVLRKAVLALHFEAMCRHTSGVDNVTWALNCAVCENIIEYIDKYPPGVEYALPRVIVDAIMVTAALAIANAVLAALENWLFYTPKEA